MSEQTRDSVVGQPGEATGEQRAGSSVEACAAPPSSALAALGGAQRLEAIVRDFYDRVFDDMMIGYMFRGVDRERLIAHEVAFTAALLGGRGQRYEGRSMRAAHARHWITGGHFARRQQLLRETLADHDVDPAARRAWLEHAEALRAQIVVGQCVEVSGGD